MQLTTNLQAKGIAHGVSPLGRLLLIGNLSIFMIGLGFAVRAKIAGNLQSDIFDAIDQAHSAALVGEAMGYTFMGFAFTLLFGSALVDKLGCKAMLLFSALGYVVGSVFVIVASFINPGSLAHFLVLAGLFCTGLGWGAVEAASNPMVAAIDPNNKIHRLNVLHAWWPAGIIVGGLFGLSFSAFGWPWQINLLLLIIPSLVLVYLVWTTYFPETERVQKGVSYAQMFKELFRQPLFYFFWVCMWLTTISELAPGQWVDLALSKIVGFQGIILLVYVSALMFVMRHFAGALSKVLPSVGILCVGSAFAALGLTLLSSADSAFSAFLAATLWAIGVCYMWPTMLATVSERFPKGGALFMGLMGFGGGMAIHFTLPHMGAIFDTAKIEMAGGFEAFSLLSGEELDGVLKYAASESFRSVVFAPLVLVPLFGLVWIRDAFFLKK